MKQLRTITAALFMLVAVPFVLHAEIPRPEHPMPQMQRDQWLNLNGTWDFAETDDNDDESYLTKEEYPDRILVPFARESKLSGLERRGFVNNVWYRRNFSVPADWNAERIRLHIGACDWITRVWVNGKFIGDHEGGFSAFDFDITDALQDGENTLIVHAYDNERSGLQPLGKQSRRAESHSIFYTRTTGIWQTVWLEGVSQSFINDFAVTPDPDHSRILIQAEVDGPSQGLTLEAVALADGTEVGREECPASWRNNYLVLPLKQKNLWSVENPFLYELKLTLKRDGKAADELDSYFGLRKVSIEGAAILINDEPVFQRLVLDQGFYPEGIWTAPTDEALRGDIELSKAVGFNGARLHQKVFEPRFHYWADQLGYLTWGEYPSYGADYDNPKVNRPLIDEWIQLVRRDRNHPSIIGWCTFNETPPDAGDLQNTILRLSRALDPTRPVIDTSGWTHSFPNPEVMDAHDYNQDPASFRDKWMAYFRTSPLPERYGHSSAPRDIPFFVSEFGGIGWFEKQDEESWGYGNHPKSIDEFYERFKGLVDAQLDNPRLFGYCYTQLTDIEQEKNGVFYYDRSPKFDAERLHAIQTRQAEFEKNPPLKVEKTQEEYTVLLGGAPDGMEKNVWKYTLSQPQAGWNTPEFDDSAWKTGKGGFGQKGNWEKWIGTPWKTSDIWLRREFNYDGQNFNKGILAIHYDNATEVSINGKSVWQRDGWNDEYLPYEITEKLRDALREGENTIAIHCHQDEGGQFIDAAILHAP